jgi:hypothetical protein
MKESIVIGLVLGLIHGFCQPVNSQQVVPNFTRGTVTSDTTTHQEITELMTIVEYSTGTSYTVTGTNINFPANPAPGSNYTLIDPGAPFQFSETILGPGIAKETQIERTTITDSITNSISVFTQ